ncbi:MAG TPA: sensor histidine kinase [Actinomycetaceae bacterium]|nr:sensor histidine kinase [Actinomycetaceae bacterium]
MFSLLGAALLFGGVVAVGIVPAGMWIEFHRETSTLELFGGWALPEPLIVLLVALTALLALTVFSYLAALFTALQSTVAHALLTPRQDEIERQIARLTVSRMTLLETFESERRRIERNLHDGVQQQLVSLTMSLAIAELDLKAAADAGYPVTEARGSVAAAHRQAEDALIELRNTVRGIHPHALSTHGLTEAIKEFAGRTPIPVEEDIELRGRLPQTIESSLYFIISEALTNAVKHSEANHIDINIRADERRAHMTIRDNGRGGVDPTRGTGIRGLRERVETHRGIFEVTSPTGGPTTIAVTIPLPKHAPDPAAGHEQGTERT